MPPRAPLLLRLPKTHLLPKRPTPSLPIPIPVLRNNYSTTPPPQPQQPQHSPPPTLLKITNIPAPHLGHIRILSLNSPHNRNALSVQLVKELWTQIRLVAEECEAEERAVERFFGGLKGRGRMQELLGEGEKGVVGGEMDVGRLFERVEAGVKGGGRMMGMEEEGEGRPVLGRGTRVLVLASELDEVFCAGADLKERRRMSDGITNTYLTLLRHTLTTLSALPIPSISLLSSPALGGGLELALATTFRICTPSALLGLPETRLGIIPGAGGTSRLRALIGETRAMEMILTGRRVGGEEAWRWGVCERFVGGGGREREMVWEAGIGMGREICGGGPWAVRGAVRAVRGCEGGEDGEYERLVGTGDRGEGLRAFGERRGVVFRGC